MDTKQILTFITLAETSNYIKAADRLNYAPSTLAKHIRSLEEELGTKLVEHRENRIRLTREGERFYAYAQKMMETYWEAMEKVAGLSHRRRAHRRGRAYRGLQPVPLPAGFLQPVPQGVRQRADDLLCPGARMAPRP